MPLELNRSDAQTLPLYDPSPADPDGWHAVRAPGGYEWWYFDAEDPASGLQVVAIFLEGFVFHPGYLRRYARYRARPTRNAPPVPSEYPCAYFAVYEGGRVLAQFMTQVPAGQFRAASGGLDVRVGDNAASRSPDGSIRLHLDGVPWRLTWRGPRRTGGDRLGADLSFAPMIGTPMGGTPMGGTPMGSKPAAGETAASMPGRHERTFLSREMSGAEHRWVLADPLCRVEGEIRLGETGAAVGGNGEGRGAGRGAGPRVIRFAGLGYHDHNYGTAPIGPGLRRWVWGRMLWEDRMITFHYARPAREDLPDEVHLVEGGGAGLREVPAARVEADWAGRTALGLRYPRELRLSPAEGGGGHDLRLDAPHVIDASPFYLRLAYDGRYGRRTGKAFCEVAYPHRLTWPVLGRMIEMSIEKPG